MDKINEVKKYFQSQIGNTEKIISISPLQQIETVLDTKDFIKNYKFSRFGSSYFSTKRLINKIFTQKLKCPIEWNNNFWIDTKIILLKCTINFIDNDNSIGILKNNRIKNVNKYVKKISQDVDLGNPLYISGDVLNMIGGSINPYEMYMVDGARRLLANALCKQKFIKIWLIISK